MIIDYSSDYFDFFSTNVSEFDVNFLNGDSPFLKNFVYLENDIPVGLISYSLIYDRIELEYIWVHKSFRNCGIGSKLMDKMLSENVSNITLEVRSSNVYAISLYEKYGFKVVSVRNNYYGSEDAFLMLREMI